MTGHFDQSHLQNNWHTLVTATHHCYSSLVHITSPSHLKAPPAPSDAATGLTHHLSCPPPVTDRAHAHASGPQPPALQRTPHFPGGSRMVISLFLGKLFLGPTVTNRAVSKLISRQCSYCCDIRYMPRHSLWAMPSQPHATGRRHSSVLVSPQVDPIGNHLRDLARFAPRAPRPAGFPPLSTHRGSTAKATLHNSLKFCLEIV